MKKTMTLAGLLLAAMTMLAACAPLGGDQGQSASAGADGLTEGTVTIRWLTYDGTKDNSGNYIKQIQADAFMKQHPEIKVVLDLQSENSSTEFLQKLDLLQMGEDGYDVVTLPAYRDYAIRAAQGYFAPLDEMLAAEQVDFEEVYAYPAKVNGAYYGIPVNPHIYHVIINKSMLDAAGLPVPPADWTWQDYAFYAKAMTTGSGEDKVYGSYLHTWTEYRRAALWMTQPDNPYVKEDGTSNLADPTFKAWLEFMKNMEDVDKSQIPYGEAKSMGMSYRDVFFSGKCAMTLTGSWIYSDINNTEKYPRDWQVVFAPFPRWENSAVGRTEGACSYNMVGANSAHQEAAYTFIRWLSSDEGRNTIHEFSAVTDGDNMTTIDALIADRQALYHTESLLAIWEDPRLEPNIITGHIELFQQVDDIFNAETEKYMVGGQSLEDTMAAIQAQGDKIIDGKTR